ncbi:hypothetical protein PG996_009730 [Apiospora saccharicola]|uniref:Uncharacterized protein n=1 Tax=Apiospora saccharicola TaxID=335842 RepID=A0ABR1ULL3_9PEZI
MGKRIPSSPKPLPRTEGKLHCPQRCSRGAILPCLAARPDAVPPTVAPPCKKEWNLQSKVSYEVLRKIGHPVYLSQCIAGTYSGIRSPTGFNKTVWNEAVQMLKEAYPGWMDEKKLEEFYWCERNFREANERIRDEKDREKRRQDKMVADSNANANANIQRLPAELNAKKGEAQDAHTASPAGPSDNEAPSPETDQADEAKVAEPQAEAVQVPEEPTEEKSTDSSHQGPKTTIQGSRADERDEPRPQMKNHFWGSLRLRVSTKA